MSDQGTVLFKKTRWYHPFLSKLRQNSWWWLLPLMGWIHEKTAHCNEPEYFKSHPKLIRWTGGLKQFSWTWICGHHFGFSFQMANIYWKIVPQKDLSVSEKS